jgi:hypothetical protein
MDGTLGEFSIVDDCSVIAEPYSSFSFVIKNQ